MITMVCAEGVKTQDARALPQEVQQYNRDQAIRLFKKGRSRRDIADFIGVSYSAVGDWITAWRKDCKQAIVLKKRGITSESKRLLTEVQEKALKQLLVEKNPRQLKLPFVLWNRKAIQSAVYQMLHHERHSSTALLQKVDQRFWP